MSTFPYATLTNIKSSSWSLMLDSTAGGGAGSGIGQVVQALDDVHQCIKIIFSTIPGEDPFRPTFGCDLTSFLDKPINTVIPAIVATVTAEIATWEPRISVVSIDVTTSTQNPGKITVTINWKPNLGTINQESTTLGTMTQTTTFSIGGK